MCSVYNNADIDYEKKFVGLYIHIPFCEKKCNYCNFSSFDNQNNMVESYFKALEVEIKLRAHQFRDFCVDAIYIGGGTPNFVDGHYLVDIFNVIKSLFKIDPDFEFTIECNPNWIDSDFIKILNALGVNRVSVGLQSCNDENLLKLGRTHNLLRFEKAYYLLRDSGVTNISLDLIYGLPDQDYSSFKKDLKRLLNYSPNHISLYNLTIEPGTKFYKETNLNLPCENTLRKMYYYAVYILENSGYFLYEISNFSRPKFESRHNIKYWKHKSYLGLGLSAHSFVFPKRWKNSSNLCGYITEQLNSKFDTRREENKFFDAGDSLRSIKKRELIDEHIMLGLRLKQGINVKEFYKVFGVDFRDYCSNYLTQYFELGYMGFDDEHIFLSKRSYFISNYIISRILP